MRSDHIHIASTVRRYPKLPYAAMKDAVLGTTYDLSLVFIGAQRAQTLNAQQRGKTYVPNVLAFPLDRTHGEIFITPAVTEREAKAYGLSKNGYVGYLFIHALLHLKGYDHGATMEKAEKRFMARFKLS